MGASAPFYLSTKESYNRLWKLHLDNGTHGLASLTGNTGKQVGSSDHVRMNAGMNGWYIDPKALCQNNPAGCTFNADGTYTLHFVMEFVPQRWFFIGCIVSSITAVLALGYVGFDIWRREERR